MRIFDVANLLSISRLPLALLIWAKPEEPVFLFTVIALAGLTDVLDGLVGRKSHETARGTKNVGAWLDPLCDKVFIASAAAAVVMTYEPPLAVLPLVLVRDLALLILVPWFRLHGGRALFHGHDFRASASGKMTTAAQVFTLASAVLAPALTLSLAVATALLGAVAVVDRVLRALKERSALHA